MKAIPPPSPGDVLLSVSALDWPAVAVDGRVITGEPAWRAALESASPDARWRLWNALRDDDGGAARATATIQAIIDGYERATPTKAEVDLVHRVARLAVTHGGLKLAPFRLRWYRERSLETLAAGYVYHTLRPVVMMLLVGRPLRDLAKTVFHEMRHVHDAVDPDLTTDERETRAERFADEMMRRWRG